MSKPVCVADCETYTNYFLLAIQNIATGSIQQFQVFGEDQSLTSVQISRIRSILKSIRIVTFNGQRYDVPMIFLALTGAPCWKLKEQSDRIIVGNMMYWVCEDTYKYKIPRDMDHVDLINVAPGTASLKSYMSRLHAKRLQDLPLPPDSIIAPDQLEMMKSYNLNDLDGTTLLHNELKQQLALRESMSKEYAIDLMSKSDAQIAEALIKQEVEKLLYRKVQKPGSRGGEKFKYKVPAWVQFQTPQLQEILEQVRQTWFVIDIDGVVGLPDFLATTKVRLGTSVYRMGIGGLHSSEKSIAHHADDETVLAEKDVVSYYPRIIIEQGLFPEHLGKEFLQVYQQMVERRVAAKKRSQELKKRIEQIKKEIAEL